jgi:hypothetical protein
VSEWVLCRGFFCILVGTFSSSSMLPLFVFSCAILVLAEFDLS